MSFVRNFDCIINCYLQEFERGVCKSVCMDVAQAVVYNHPGKQMQRRNQIEGHKFMNELMSLVLPSLINNLLTCLL